MLSVYELALLGFAAYRGTQLVVHDSILDGWRAKLEMWHARKHESKIRTFVRDLLGCTYCSGFWISVVTVIAYLTATHEWSYTPWLAAAIDVWAVAGIQALLSRWDDTMGGGH